MSTRTDLQFLGGGLAQNHEALHVHYDRLGLEWRRQETQRNRDRQLHPPNGEIVSNRMDKRLESEPFTTKQ